MSFKKEMKDIEKDMKKIEENIKRDINYAEKWMHERKKFLVKLAWVLGFITILLITSHYYLRVRGFG